MKPWAIRLLLAVGLLVPLGALSEARAQEAGTITGTVTSDVGRPLPGAAVTIVGTQRGTVTGSDGTFELTGVPAGTHTLRASSLGFAVQETSVTVQSGTPASVALQLQSQAVELEGVVAVGYGTQQRVNLTGAVASVNTEEMARSMKVEVS